MKTIEDKLLNSILKRDYLSQKLLNKLNNNNIILYPIYDKDKTMIKEILIIGGDGDRLYIDSNIELSKEIEFLELVLFIKEIEAFLLLEDEKIIKKKLEDFNSQYMTIATPILDMIFEMDGDLKILRANIDFDSFMGKYRYRAMEYGLNYLSQTILTTIPRDTKKVYLATTSGLNRMSSYSI